MITYKFQAYMIRCNHSKRRAVQECLLGIEKSCTSCLLGVEKSCTDLTNVVLSSGVQGVDFECIKIRIRKILIGLLGDWT